MARFRLIEPAYLKVPGTEYELKEADEVTKKQVTKRFQVPLYLDPRDPNDHNYPGEIIVSTKQDRAHPKDIIFAGPPIPGMEPLDPEADKIFAEWQKKWEKHPIESLPTTMGTSQI